MPHASRARVDAVRAFNRFYTREIGALDERLLRGPFSLTEARVLYELAHTDGVTAAGLRRDLRLDAGYLSRILRRFHARGLVRGAASAEDGRARLLHLTRAGRTAFAPLDTRARTDVAARIARLPDEGQRELVGAMTTVERLLGESPDAAAPWRVRAHRPGDMGWVVERHGALYAREYGYTPAFEALVARICADFLDRFDARAERCSIAERDGVPIGSAFVVRKSKTVAKLRLLIVDPAARGLGVGRRLVDECVRFAREAGYRSITLWTHSQLVAARRIYEQAGFRCVDAQPTHSFGRDLVDETWTLSLAAPRS